MTPANETTTNSIGKVRFETGDSQSGASRHEYKFADQLVALPPADGRANSTELPGLNPRSRSRLSRESVQKTFLATAAEPQENAMTKPAATVSGLKPDSNTRKNTKHHRHPSGSSTHRNRGSVSQLSDSAILAVGQAVPSNSKLPEARTNGKNRKNSTHQGAPQITPHFQHPQLGPFYGYMGYPSISTGYGLATNPTYPVGGPHPDAMMHMVVPPAYPVPHGIMPPPAPYASNVQLPFNQCNGMQAANQFITIASGPNGGYQPVRAVGKSLFVPERSHVPNTKAPPKKTFTDDVRRLPSEEGAHRRRSADFDAGAKHSNRSSHSRQNSRASNDFGPSEFAHRPRNSQGSDFSTSYKSRPRSWIVNQGQNSVAVPVERCSPNQSTGGKSSDTLPQNESLLAFRGWCHDSTPYPQQCTGRGTNSATGGLQQGWKHQKRASFSSTNQRHGPVDRTKLYVVTNVSDASVVDNRMRKLKGHIHTTLKHSDNTLFYFSTLV
jgi:hypothetical protein